MNAFILAYYNIISIILFYPIFYIFRDNPNLVLTMGGVSTLSFLIIIPYFFKKFYSEYSFKQVFKRFLIFLVLATIFTLILFTAVVIGYVVYLATFNPEALQQFAPPPKS